MKSNPVTAQPSSAAATDLAQILDGPVYQAYAYSYPHKTAYRPFEERVALAPLWQQEKLDALFLYVHIPFCSMRCGFCNLFTLVKPEKTLPDLYLDALERQIKALTPVIEQAQFARYAIGGGTPTFLTELQLARLFDLTDFAGIQANTPIGIETSPETITAGKIQLLTERNVSRISMGIQSFTDLEVKNLARKQNKQEVFKAIETIRQYSQADLNLDLIYGIAGQTVSSWLHSLEQALQFNPEELYLYPLYVREATGLGKVKQQARFTPDLADTDMLALYRTGRDFLLAHGYQQVSMRMFRRAELTELDLPHYSCQEDGMLGLGAGARSYTQTLHYSSEYAVGRHGVKDIIGHFTQQTEADFSHAHYGIKLTLDERKRRFVMQSLLIADGLNLREYEQRFKRSALVDFPALTTLINAGLVQQAGALLLLTVAGFERADSIGPWFASQQVKQAMSEYQLQ
ncbi:STM4012 family radical SAM protein [Motilimonas sp. E26]|uniref:STM4012 family radical SAM protein n=1 Tax=Motilimonas sp. E26 TaxID=2865674 RepID=UPI001E625063|nr:STM4012 family radical SAM protein [Motilimonas sp. E26]MCE0557868.1 STM4012 family radical SAM protein [Motilimonas sp. E26]